MAWSAAARAHHGSFRPSEPKFNDVVPFESKWLMDDGVAVEPMVGNRVFDSLAVLDETMQLVWGPEGVNVEKMAEEGEPSTILRRLGSQSRNASKPSICWVKPSYRGVAERSPFASCRS